MFFPPIGKPSFKYSPHPFEPMAIVTASANRDEELMGEVGEKEKHDLK
jgi:hypothetical protein